MYPMPNFLSALTPNLLTFIYYNFFLVYFFLSALAARFDKFLVLNFFLFFDHFHEVIRLCVWNHLVVIQPYETDVIKEFAIRGNAAIMKCQVPSYVSDFISIISWHTDREEEFRPGQNYGKKSKKFKKKRKNGWCVAKLQNVSRNVDEISSHFNGEIRISLELLPPSPNTVFSFS